MKNIKILFNILKNIKMNNLFYIIFLMISVSILEVLSVGIVIPLVNIILSDNYLNSIVEFFNFKVQNNHVVIIFIFIMMIFFLLKNFYILRVIKLYYSFALKVLFKIREKIFQNYVFSEYINFLNKNQTNMLHNLTSASNQFASNYLMSIIILLSEVMIFLFLLAFMLFFNIKLTVLLMFFIFLTIFLYLKIISPKLKLYGYQRNINEESIIGLSRSGLQNIKEIKIFGKENIFMNYFNDYSKRSLDSLLTYSVSSQFPRIGIELFASFAMCLTIFFLQLNSYKNYEILSTLALFGVAMFRILPSINKLLTSYQNMKFTTSSLKIIEKEILTTQKKNTIFTEVNNLNFIFKKKIKFENVFFKYPKNEQEFLKNINFEINKGDRVSIIGMSGSGKSTIMDLMLGLLRPTKGRILIDEYDLSENIKNWQKKCGYVSQSLFFLDDSLEKNIAFGIPENEIDMQKVSACLKSTNLISFFDSEKKIKESIGENGKFLSGGQKQRIAIARALYVDPEIIFFDEATNMLDKKTQAEVLDCIFGLKNKTIVFISHDPIVEKYCNRKFILQDCSLIEK
jgi:ABC-type multidrug transport system fused ATPase/permease subunit